MNKLFNRSIFVSSILGLMVSAYLAYEYSLSGPVTCPVGKSSCEVVRKSAYSSFLGIQLPYLGILFYLVMAFLSVWIAQSYDRLINLLRLLISFSGFVFGVYLTYLEAFVINAYCFWCVTSFMISIIILILCIVNLKTNEQ